MRGTALPDFNPKSYNITVTESTGQFQVQQKISWDFRGYWNKLGSFENLTPGNYTAKAIDIFNQTEIAHFAIN